MQSQNTKAIVSIRSRNKFKITICNGYMPTLVAIPGTGRTEMIQNPADVPAQPAQVFKTWEVMYKTKDKFVDSYFKGEIYTVPNYYFFEDPVIEGINDPHKKLNYHFKNFKKGDNVPVEYILWRWIHSRCDDIVSGLFRFEVTESNYPLVQWVLQAIYNDQLKDFAKMDRTLLRKLFANLEGKKELVKQPDKEINTVVGEFNLLEANAGHIQESIDKLKKEIAAKEALLLAAQELSMPASVVAIDPVKLASIAPTPEPIVAVEETGAAKRKRTNPSQVAKIVHEPSTKLPELAAVGT